MIVDVAFGFLGSGKTTFITRILKEWGSDEKIVVLVNEFGDMGIDGELLSSAGGNVVEMPSGCICCTLQADFRTQILEISRTIRPDRLIIEPTGVATIGQIQWILAAQMFEESIEKIHKVMIADATGFMGLYKANRHFVESQVENAHLVLLNKCDRVDKRKALVIRAAISAINPELTVLMTEFGAVDWGEYLSALSSAPGFNSERDNAKSHLSIDPKSKDHIAKAAHKHQANLHEAVKIYDHPEDVRMRSPVNEEEDALGYESFGLQYEERGFERGALESFFQELKASESKFGEIVRAKGIFQTEKNWVIIELASGEVSAQPVKPFNQNKVSIIGRKLRREMIREALEGCITGPMQPNTADAADN